MQETTKLRTDPRPRGIPAQRRARMAMTHLECAETIQPQRRQHQQAARRQLQRALEALDFEMERDA
jgi:hypothetical protein